MKKKKLTRPTTIGTNDRGDSASRPKKTKKSSIGVSTKVTSVSEGKAKDLGDDNIGRKGTRNKKEKKKIHPEPASSRSSTR